jgi:hypothetical protein
MQGGVGGGVGGGAPLPLFVWNGLDYLHKMCNDLDFLAACEPLVRGAAVLRMMAVGSVRRNEGQHEETGGGFGGTVFALFARAGPPLHG